MILIDQSIKKAEASQKASRKRTVIQEAIKVQHVVVYISQLGRVHIRCDGTL